MSKPDGGPAFPFTINHGDQSSETAHGMSLRDYFAAAALQGMMANDQCVLSLAKMRGGDDGSGTAAARVAYIHADAMLAERDK